MFSVIIPLYNKEISVRKTIQSVINQSFTEFEIIIVNDGSTDLSLKVVESISDSRIHIIDKPNGGVSSARNRGIEAARFDWVAFLDGDDIWEPNHLEVVKRLVVDYPKDNVFCTSFIKSGTSFPVQNATSVVPEVIDNYFEKAIHGHFLWTSVAVVRRSIFANVGLFNQKLILGEDLDLWARLGRSNRIIRSKKVTAIYNTEAENRACTKKYNYSKSFISIIDLSGKSGSERNYLLYLLRRRFFISLRTRDFSMAFKILKKML